MEFKTKLVLANMFKKCEEACMDAKSKFVPKYGDSDVYICLQDPTTPWCNQFKTQ